MTSYCDGIYFISSIQFSLWYSLSVLFMSIILFCCVCLITSLHYLHTKLYWMYGWKDTPNKITPHLHKINHGVKMHHFATMNKLRGPFPIIATVSCSSISFFLHTFLTDPVVCSGSLFGPTHFALLLRGVPQFRALLFSMKPDSTQSFGRLCNPSRTSTFRSP